MHVHFLDPFINRSSLIHQLDPRIKLILTISFILIISLIPVGIWPVYLILLALVISLEILSELGVHQVMKRSTLALPFILAALPLVFYTKGAIAYSLTIGSWEIIATHEGITRFASIAFKSWLSVQVAIVLASSTTFPDLLIAMRTLRVPRLLVAIFSLMWRYLFVLADEALRLMRARSSRSGISTGSSKKIGRSIAWRAKVTGGMAGNLFVRAIERSDRIYTAMLARGYDGEVRSLPFSPLRRLDWLILCCGLIKLIILYFMAILL